MDLVTLLGTLFAEEPNMKPHQNIFLKACKIVGCKPEESIMVGDTIKTDIEVRAPRPFSVNS